MCSLPTWEGVGGESGVDQSEISFEKWIRQIGEIGPKLVRSQLSLVDDRPSIQRANIKPFSWGWDGVARPFA